MMKRPGLAQSFIQPVQLDRTIRGNDGKTNFIFSPLDRTTAGTQWSVSMERPGRMQSTIVSRKGRQQLSGFGAPVPHPMPSRSGPAPMEVIRLKPQTVTPLPINIQSSARNVVGYSELEKAARFMTGESPLYVNPMTGQGRMSPIAPVSPGKPVVYPTKTATRSGLTPYTIPQPVNIHYVSPQIVRTGPQIVRTGPQIVRTATRSGLSPQMVPTRMQTPTTSYNWQPPKPGIATNIGGPGSRGLVDFFTGLFVGKPEAASEVDVIPIVGDSGGANYISVM